MRTITADLVLEAGDRTGECPTWDERAGLLWWTDINGRRLHRYDPSSGRHETFATAERVGCFALREQGGLVVGMEHRLAFLDLASGEIESIAEVEAEHPRNRFNDGRCDRRGRLLAGTMNEAHDGPKGSLWRLDASLRPHAIATGVTIANGLAFSPDDRILYWSDTPQGVVWAYDYDLDQGTLRNRRVWLDRRPDVPGLPDGAAVDAEGCYWTARWQGSCLLRFTPDGRLDRQIRLPASRVTMCSFGGPDLATLYITTARHGMTEEELAKEPLAGALFAVDAGVRGLPEPRFAG